MLFNLNIDVSGDFDDNMPHDEQISLLRELIESGAESFCMTARLSNITILDDEEV